MNAAPGGWPLQRRLIVSYVVAVAPILAALAVVVHLAFANNARRLMAERLDFLAQAGLNAVEPARKGFTVNDRVRRLLSPGEGLAWYAADGRRAFVKGDVPPAALLPQGTRPAKIFDGDVIYETVALPMPTGTVRAFRNDERFEAELQTLDIGLLSGTLLALILSVGGVWILTAQAVRRIDRSVGRLREFTADAAHELRSPLSAIVGNADAALRDERATPDVYRGRLDAIASASREMQVLVDDLLVLAHADGSTSHDLQVVDLADRVRVVTERNAPTARMKGIELMAVGAGVRIYGNPDDIDRILANLIANAVHYTPAGGRVAVSVERNRRCVSIVVSDTGIGIAPDHLDRVFDRFWRADPARSPSDGGVGLGLAIVRALAERNGGRIGVQSTLGAGSRFTVVFPATAVPR